MKKITKRETLISIITFLTEKLLNLVFPPKCLISGKKVSKHGLIAAEIWNDIFFIEDPKCAICSLPFLEKNNHSDELFCLSCLNKRPIYDKAICAFAFEGQGREIIHKLKYNDATELALLCTKILYPKISMILNNDIDYITAVPMFKKRLAARKYNQSVLLAKNLAKKHKDKILVDLLKKIKDTKPQSQTFSANQRKSNLIGAFAVNKKYLIKEKNILLIDDVITTGNTVNSCARLLKKAGAKKVYVAALAKNL